MPFFLWPLLGALPTGRRPLLLAALLLGSTGAAQGQAPHPLQVGQKVPDSFWTYEHLFYSDGDTIRQPLAQHKGKMLVLDFWFSGCPPCLLQQQQISEYTRRYPQELAVIMVNSSSSHEDYSTLKMYAAKGRFTQAGIETLRSIIEDRYLEQLFPYRSYPTYIWINESGYVQTQTFRNLLDNAYYSPFLSRSL